MQSNKILALVLFCAGMVGCCSGHYHHRHYDNCCNCTNSVHHAHVIERGPSEFYVK